MNYALLLFFVCQLPSMPNDLVGIAVYPVSSSGFSSEWRESKRVSFAATPPFLGDKVIFSPFEFMCEKKGSSAVRNEGPHP